ncbi:hypothetical protein GHAL_2764 [Hafnia alvei ATCC 13337]|uniref:Uncharacterized protein n=1 Tax=Hafnia alvei ATCC 13337 TaxID=910996 RepID=A0ABD3ZEI6_HAFAL|nr:hypothetical protein GHAL_2764 [Hafnia alvei ATCC 13337]
MVDGSDFRTQEIEEVTGQKLPLVFVAGSSKEAKQQNFEGWPEVEIRLSKF